jgi:Transglycosylase
VPREDALSMKLPAALIVLCTALTAWAWRVVHTPLAPRCEAELRRFSDDVHVGAARIAGLAVELTDVRVGPLHAERARVGIDRRHALLTNIQVRQFAASELALDFAAGHLKRAAFSGGSLGPLGGLAGVATRDGDHFNVRVARPGLLLTGQAGAAAAVHVELERLPLAGLLPAGLEGGLASGTVEIARRGPRWEAHGRLDVDDLAVDHRAIAGRRLEHLHPSVEGELTWEHEFRTHHLEVRLQPLAVTLSGRLGDDFDLDARIQPLRCAAALAALRPVVPALDGMLLDGELGGTVRAGGRGRSVDDLDVDLDVGCRVKKDAPLADLAHVDVPIAVPLASLPPPVVRAFLAAEDGRFFRHHGFDADMIRHALSHDLDAGRIEKGASTITQQLVKNLYLSGERTLARKLEEAVLAWRAEQVLGKERILELYLNIVELAPGTRGLADGAERYFGKEPDQLTTDEAAQLAALLPAPRRGMDAAWQKRYAALAARLPSEHIKLTRR